MQNDGLRRTDYLSRSENRGLLSGTSRTSSRGAVPSTTVNHYRFAGKNIPITCAGVTVNPGDIVSADMDGIVVVPQQKAAAVLTKAEQLDNSEHSMYPYIEKYKSIREAVKKFGRI